MEIVPLYQKFNRKLFIGFLLVCLIIAIIIDVKLKIDNQINFDTFVNWVTGFSTLFTAIIVLFTLFEIKEQRLSTYKPVIAIKDTSINVKWDSDTDDPLEFSILDNNTTSTDNKKQRRLMGFESYNIGLGAAQKICISYTYNLQNIIEKINELDKDSKIKISSSNTILSIKTNSCGINYNPINCDNINIDYILPLNIDSKPKYISLPSQFIDFFLVYLYLLRTSSEKRHDTLEQIAEVNKCKMTIKYQDIGNELNIKEYEVELIIAVLIGNTGNDLMESRILIQTKEINQ